MFKRRDILLTKSQKKSIQMKLEKFNNLIRNANRENFSFLTVFIYNCFFSVQIDGGNPKKP